jgi:hypothetical protein
MPFFFLIGVILFYTLYIMTKGSTGRKQDYSYRASNGQPLKTQTDFSYRPPHGQPSNTQTDFSYRNKIPISSNRTEASATQKQGLLTKAAFAEITGLSGRQLDEEYEEYTNRYKDFEDNEKHGKNPNALVGPRTQYKRNRSRARARSRTQKRTRSRSRARDRTRAHRLR